MHVVAGFNRIISRDAVVRDNTGAEIGAIASLPFHLWREDQNLVTFRAQYTRFSNEISPDGNSGSEPVRLFYPSHSQLKFDYRQIFSLWAIDFSFGFGYQLPVYNGVLTPLGRLTFAEATAIYPQAREILDKIGPSHAIYARFGIDQKFLDDALIAGIGFEVNAWENPKTLQRFSFNFYAGARVW